MALAILVGESVARAAWGDARSRPRVTCNEAMGAARARCRVELAQIVCSRGLERKVSMRRGASAVELTMVLVIVGIVLMVGRVPVTGLRDRMSVRAATSDIVAAFAMARRWALSRAAPAAVSIDAVNAVVTVRSFTDTIAIRRLGATHGVALVATRDSMAYAPNGLGYGAANLTIIVRRGDRADTIVVSRLGRVRR